MKQIGLVAVAMVLCGMLADMASNNNMEYTAGAFLALGIALFTYMFVSAVNSAETKRTKQ